MAVTCRGLGWQAQTLVDVFGEAGAQSADDETWIAHAGLHNLVVLTKDERIARRTREQAAVISSEAKVFCLVARRAPMRAFVSLLLDHHLRIEQRVRSHRGTGFWKVYPDRIDFKF